MKYEKSTGKIQNWSHRYKQTDLDFNLNNRIRKCYSLSKKPMTENWLKLLSIKSRKFDLISVKLLQSFILCHSRLKYLKKKVLFLQFHIWNSFISEIKNASSRVSVKWIKYYFYWFTNNGLNHLLKILFYWLTNASLASWVSMDNYNLFLNIKNMD